MAEGPELLSREVLKRITGNFSRENLIGRTHFGDVFKGLSRDAEVTVKLWGFIFDGPKVSDETLLRNKSRVLNEVRFLTDPSNCGQCCIPKLRGYYLDEENPEMFAVVYDFASSDTLLKVITNDDFSWSQRIGVVRELAHLLDFLHGQEPSYRVCNLDPVNIMLTKEQKPMLIDFSLIARKDRLSEDDWADILLLVNGFLDDEPLRGMCFVENDVYSFGLLLVGLISKHVHHDPVHGRLFSHEFCQWVYREYEGRKINGSSNSLAHDSFREDVGFDDFFATKITKLAMRCLHEHLHWRPSMKFLKRLLDNSNPSGNLGLDYVDGITTDILWDRDCNLEKISFLDLQASAETFNRENMIGPTQFGALYKGTAKFQGYIVKTWGGFHRDQDISEQQLLYNWYRFKNEIKFLIESPRRWHLESPHRWHRWFPKLKAYFCDEGKNMFAVVYNLSSRDHDTLMNLITKDDFTWTRRIEVALELAHAIKELHCHDPPYKICDLDWCSILLHEGRKPILVDFSLITSIYRGCEEWQCLFYDWTFRFGVHRSCIVGDLYSRSEDVYSFASILLGLISKHLRTFGDFDLPEWAAYECKHRFSGSPKVLCSLADKSFESESGFHACTGAIITKLASVCHNATVSDQPSIEEVVEILEACHSFLEVKVNQEPYIMRASDIPCKGSQWSLTTFSKEDLKMCSEIISIEANGFIKVYSGKFWYDKYATVKMWHCDSSLMMDMQIFFLSLPKVRKKYHFAELVGYHKSDSLNGVVYNFQAKGTLGRLIEEGELTWIRSLYVALSIAEILAFFHGLFFHEFKYLHLICNIDAEHILLDEEFNPLLPEFSMLNGTCWKMHGTCCSEKSDVYSFGDVLRTLLSKNEGPKSDSTLVVHHSLKADPHYNVQQGEQMVALALRCLNTDLEQRPTMKEIINCFPLEIYMMVQALRTS